MTWFLLEPSSTNFANSTPQLQQAGAKSSEKLLLREIGGEV